LTFCNRSTQRNSRKFTLNQQHSIVASLVHEIKDSLTDLIFYLAAKNFGSVHKRGKLQFVFCIEANYFLIHKRKLAFFQQILESQ